MLVFALLEPATLARLHVAITVAIRKLEMKAIGGVGRDNIFELWLGDCGFPMVHRGLRRQLAALVRQGFGILEHQQGGVLALQLLIAVLDVVALCLKVFTFRVYCLFLLLHFVLGESHLLELEPEFGDRDGEAEDLRVFVCVGLCELLDEEILRIDLFALAAIMHRTGLAQGGDLIHDIG
jgi:hypothetical protein